MLAAAILLVAGCASTYRQSGVEQLGATSIAVLESQGASFSDAIIIEFVDGKWRGVGNFTRYELTPGYHEIGSTYSDGRGLSSKKVLYVGFVAEAGHTYSIRANAEPQELRWHPEIVDQQTGAVVGKIVRSEDVGL